MPEPRGRNQLLVPTLVLAAVIAVLLIGAGLLWAQEGERGRQRPEYSVLRTDERGAALVFRLYERMGLQPKVWDADLARLKAPGILFLLAPAQEGGGEGDVLPPEIRALDEWVRQGNVVVVMARSQNPVYRALGLIVDPPKGRGSISSEPTQPSVLAEGVEKLTTQNDSGFAYGRKKDETAKALKTADLPEPIDATPPAQWVELFAKSAVPKPLPAVVSASRGKGLVVAVNDVFPASNVGLTQGGNARFMLNLARLRPAGGTVWFDEFHKRSVERGLIAYLRERSLAPALIYLAVVLALLAWRSGTRFGAPQPLLADRRRDSHEYVQAVAALYGNARMGREALATLYADFQRRTFGRSRGGDAEEVGRRYAERTGRPPEEAVEILQAVETALASSGTDEHAAVKLAARLTQLDRALNRRAPKRNKDQEHA